MKNLLLSRQEIQDKVRQLAPGLQLPPDPEAHRKLHYSQITAAILVVLAIVIWVIFFCLVDTPTREEVVCPSTCKLYKSLFPSKRYAYVYSSSDLNRVKCDCKKDSGIFDASIR